MGRKTRICRPDSTYHTCSRCIDSTNLMEMDSIKDILLDVIKRTCQIYTFSLVGYEILDNHFHFIIKTAPGGATISQIMQHIKGNFTRKYNKRMGRTGPFWNERFGDRIIEDSDNPFRYLLWLLWYLAFNSVRKRKVWDPRSYKYSSIRAYLEENYEGPLPITLHDYFINLGSTFAERVQVFLEFEEVYRKRLFYYI